MKKHRTMKSILWFSEPAKWDNKRLRRLSLVYNERLYFETKLMHELNVKEGEMDAVEYCRKIGTIQRMDF